ARGTGGGGPRRAGRSRRRAQRAPPTAAAAAGMSARLTPDSTSERPRNPAARVMVARSGARDASSWRLTGLLPSPAPGKEELAKWSSLLARGVFAGEVPLVGLVGDGEVGHPRVE